MVSATLSPLQAESWLISILPGLGAVPSYFTVPLMVATVAGSIGLAAGAGVAAFSSVALEDCSVFSFLLHAPSSSRLARQTSASTASHVFLIMMSPLHLEYLKCPCESVAQNLPSNISAM